MKIDLFNSKEFIDLNKLKEVTSPVLFQRGEIPHPDGLVSNQIFGVTVQSRKSTFAYVDLQGYFFHPHVYKAIKLSKATIRNIKQNLFWAFFYNTCGLPLAAGVLYAINGTLLSPIIGGFAMSLSSVCVVSNALRLRKQKLN